MKIRKAVITAAAQSQRRLPLQSLIDRDGQERSVLAILIEEAVRAHIEEIAVVVWPGDETAYEQVIPEHAARVRFVPQSTPRGYGHAVWCAREFTAGDPFLHLVSDHLYVGAAAGACASRVVDVAEAERSPVSAVQATHESLITGYGVVGAHRAGPGGGHYRVETVIEKPTPTEAEQRLVVPGMRAGYYLCFFGIHVLTPAIMEILDEAVAGGQPRVSLSQALAQLATRERYLALEMDARRYDVGLRYGLLTAQLALALSGRDRDEVLTMLVRLLATQEHAGRV
jgi:UTP--glucose-1-phosphate uridylyltransferase